MKFTLNTLLFFASIVTMIACGVVAGICWEWSEDKQETVDTFTDIDTRATFDISDQTNSTVLALGPANQDVWAQIPGGFDSKYDVTVVLNNFVQDPDAPLEITHDT